jgi:hypothetical protein
MSKLSAEERRKLPLSDFAGSGRTFPIVDQSDVHDVARLIGHASNPNAVKAKIIRIARRKGFSLPAEWEAEKKPGIKKAALTGATDFTQFVQFAKVGNDEERIVEGYISSERLDDQNQVVTFQAISNAMPDYLKWSNIRAMHKPIAAGRVISARPLPEVHKYYVQGHIVDDDSWNKVKAGVYKGFSIGGSILPGGAEMAKLEDGTPYQRLNKIKLVEISLVDRPANPDAVLTLWKGANLVEEQTTQAATGTGENVAPTHADNFEPIIIQKAATPDPSAVLQQLQALRNQYETDRNMDAAQMITEAISLILEADSDEQTDENGGDGDVDDAAVDAATGAGIDATDTPVAMASKVLDLVKAGRVMNSELMGHAQTAHDSLEKMARAAGHSFCKGDGFTADADTTDQGATNPTGPANTVTTSTGLVARDDNANKHKLPAKKFSTSTGADSFEKSFMPKFEQFAKSLGDKFDGVLARIERLESQPQGGGPVLTGAINKSIGVGGGQPTQNPLDLEITQTMTAISGAPNDSVRKSLESHLTTLQIRKAQSVPINPIDFWG